MWVNTTGLQLLYTLAIAQNVPFTAEGGVVVCQFLCPLAKLSYSVYLLITAVLQLTYSRVSS